MKRYANAQDVLPDELVREIQQHTNNLYLWIPSTSMEETRERNAYIIEQWEDNVPVRDIARTVHLSTDTVYKILQEWKRRNSQ